jgi:hypothetical protein
MTAIIFKPTKNAMQSGPGHDNWILEYQLEEKFIEPLMGWTGSTNTKEQFRLKFVSREAALAYAAKHNIDYVIDDPKEKLYKPKSYAQNFTK